MQTSGRYRKAVGLATMLAAIGMLAAAFSCSKPRAQSEAADPPTVAVARAESGNLSQSLTLAAEFRPFQEIDVHAKVAGYLKVIYVDVGDRVAAGQLLAVLEIPELRDEVTQDEAAVKRSQEEINRARADLARAQSAHEVAHLGATRLEGVIKTRPNLVAQQEIDEATARDREAEAQVATASAALAAAQQALAVSTAAASKTKTLLDYARITAPFGGVVTHRYADTGAMIQAGTSSQTQAMPIVKLSQNERLRLTIPVPESAVSHIRVGEPVDVRVEALNRTFPGQVARFAGKVNADTRTMDTEVDVPNKDLTLVPGMYAYATLALERATGVLTIPVEALDRGEDKTTVMAVRNGTVETREVKVGLEGPDRVEIRAGLAPGELVVVGSRGQIRPGERVTPKLDGAAAGETDDTPQRAPAQGDK
jgi:RND family efflux transporter MFP subunit